MAEYVLYFCPDCDRDVADPKECDCGDLVCPRCGEELLEYDDDDDDEMLAAEYGSLW